MLIPSLSCLLPLPLSYSLYIISPSFAKICRAHFLRWFRCGGTEIDKNNRSFFSTFPFSAFFFDAYLHLTVMIACLRLDSQSSVVNFCAQAADFVSSKFPIWAFGWHFLSIRCRGVAILTMWVDPLSPIIRAEVHPFPYKALRTYRNSGFGGSSPSLLKY